MKVLKHVFVNQYLGDDTVNNELYYKVVLLKLIVIELGQKAVKGSSFSKKKYFPQPSHDHFIVDVKTKTI